MFIFFNIFDSCSILQLPTFIFELLLISSLFIFILLLLALLKLKVRTSCRVQDSSFYINLLLLSQAVLISYYSFFYLSQILLLVLFRNFLRNFRIREFFLLCLPRLFFSYLFIHSLNFFVKLFGICKLEYRYLQIFNVVLRIFLHLSLFGHYEIGNFGFGYLVIDFLIYKRKRGN